MTEKTINYIKLPDGETYRVGGSSGFNLFDTKVSDHVLEGEEALGWALQGTYVYKEGVAGSRTGYADFYNRCVEEYNNSTLGESVTGAQWVQPVNPSGITTSGWQNVVNAFDDNSNTYTTINNVTDYIEWNLGEYLAVSGFTATGIWVDSVAAGTELTIYSVDAEGNEKLLGTSTGSSNNSSPYTLNCSFTPVVCNKLRFKATNGQERYPSRIAEIKITANQLMGIYTNPNGHKFYPISQKPYIDSIYESTGIADFYGVDTENERIFLPRDKYFAVTGGVAVAGNGKALGLTDGNTDYYLRNGTVGTSNSAVLTPGTSSTLGDGSSSVSLSANKGIGIVKDPTKSGIEGQLTPNENKYLYICVGNTKVESAVTNVTEITTSENDTLPLFHNFYAKEDMTTTGAYVNASLGSYLSGNVYATAYNELVNKLGTDNVKSITDKYTDYDFVVNQENMTFRLPMFTQERKLIATGTNDYNGTWSLYADGWYEENGNIDTTKEQDVTVTLTRSYNATDYSLMRTNINSSSGNTSYRQEGFSSVTTSSFVFHVPALTVTTKWETSGYATISISDYSLCNLYYKVANAVTNLELLDVAKVMNDAVLKSSLVEANVIVESYVNGTSGYNVYSNGYCEQWGIYQFTGTHGTSYTINLLKEMKDTNYLTYRGGTFAIGTTTGIFVSEISKTATNFVVQYCSQTGGSYAVTYNWKACGYIK